MDSRTARFSYAAGMVAGVSEQFRHGMVDAEELLTELKQQIVVMEEEIQTFQVQD